MSILTSGAATAIGSISKCKPMNKLCTWFRKDPSKALAYTTIASIALKDGIGCGMYVYQSLHNEKIPEKRRKFVSALDLTNGILMIVSQVGMFFGMRKLNDKLFSKLFSKSFGAGKAFEKILQEQVRVEQKNSGILKPAKKFLISKEYAKLRKDCFDTFASITELVASTILAKRVIVPFIATPLAGKVEKYMDKKDAEAKGANNVNAADVSMKGKIDVVSSADNKTTSNDGNTNLLAKYRK